MGRLVYFGGPDHWPAGVTLRHWVRRAVARVTAPTGPHGPDPVPVIANAPGSPLRGHVDDPRPDSLLSRNAVVVRGWHLWGDGAALAVAIEVNGKVVGQAATGTESRPDVARALGVARYAESGWRGIIDLAHEPGDEFVLTVSVWPAPEVAPIELEPVTVRLGNAGASESAGTTGPNRFHGALDLPRPAAPLERGPVNLVGWALTDRLPVSRVEVSVNGESAGRARLGLDRSDVARHHRTAHAEVSGFECLVDLSSLPAAATTVVIEVIAWSLGEESNVITKRRYRLSPPLVGTDRSARMAVLGHRFEEIRSTHQPGPDLNLVVFTHDLGYGGGQLWLAELLRQAGAGRRFDCTVVSPVGGPLLDEFERQGIEVHVTQDYPLRDIESYEGRIMETALWLASRSHTAALVNTFGAFFGADAATRLGLATVWAIHESWAPSVYWSVAYPPDYVHPDVRRAALHALSATGALIFEAEETRRQYLGSAVPERAVVVPYGIDSSAIDQYRAATSRAQARRSVGLPPDARVLLIMGTTERRKGQTVVAEAFARMAREYPDTLLVFVGNTGTPYAEALARLLRKAGVERQARLVPVVEDTYRWYRAADLLVSASDVESLPRSVLEAMCFGLPVLATSVFGLPELIDDGVTGFLYEPLDLAETIRALRRVLDLGPEDLAAVAEAGRQLVAQHYDSAGYAIDVIALLNGLRKDPAASLGEILAADGRATDHSEISRP